MTLVTSLLQSFEVKQERDHDLQDAERPPLLVERTDFSADGAQRRRRGQLGADPLEHAVLYRLLFSAHVEIVHPLVENLELDVVGIAPLEELGDLWLAGEQVLLADEH